MNILNNIFRRFFFSLSLKSLSPLTEQYIIGTNVIFSNSKNGTIYFDKFARFDDYVKVGCVKGKINFGERLITKALSRMQCDGMITGGKNITLGERNIISVKSNGHLTLGDAFRSDRDVELVADGGELSLHEGCYIGHGTTIAAKEDIVIGENTLIADLVSIRDHDHKYSYNNAPLQSGYISAPIVIEKNCWIGSKVTICRGVTIGRNSVIGANSVVTKDINSHSIAAGIPAKVIKTIQSEDES